MDSLAVHHSCSFIPSELFSSSQWASMARQAGRLPIAKLPDMQVWRDDERAQVHSPEAYSSVYRYFIGSAGRDEYSRGRTREMDTLGLMLDRNFPRWGSMAQAPTADMLAFLEYVRQRPVNAVDEAREAAKIRPFPQAADLWQASSSSEIDKASHHAIVVTSCMGSVHSSKWAFFSLRIATLARSYPSKSCISDGCCNGVHL